MFVLVGYGTKRKKDIWAGRFTCPICGQVSNHHLYAIKHYGSIFYIPIIQITKKRLLVCDFCQASRELSKKDYKQRRASQIEQRNIGGFPCDVIAEDYNPKKTKFGWKVFWLVLASLFLGLMAAMTAVLAADLEIWDAGTILGTVILLAMGGFPFAFALKNMCDAKKRKNIYASACRDHALPQ